MAPPVTVRLDPMEHVLVHRHVDGIRLLHGNRYVLLHRYGHVFLHRDRYHLLHGERNLFLHWDRHSLHHGDRHRLRDRYVNWKRLWYSYGDRMWNSYRHWLSNWHTCGRVESPNWDAIRRIFIIYTRCSKFRWQEKETFRLTMEYLYDRIWNLKTYVSDINTITIPFIFRIKSHTNQSYPSIDKNRDRLIDIFNNG